MLHLRGLQPLRLHRQYSSKIRLKSKANELSSMEIRNMFLNYFTEEHNHKFIRSSPVVPFCDPTVPFVNAGMNQFKNIFLGTASPHCNAAVNSQKCIRVGGKHNDLNIIGTDGYHHTFFEMLGNWSFGDYFKDKACRMAWDLLTNFYKIDSSRLYVTYFGGDANLGLAPDLECKEIWQSIGVPCDRILPFGVKENFWEMGATGPCGTCTEIHIDHLPDSNPEQRARFVNAGLPDLTELWNVVFIEYNRNSDGTLAPLKQKFIDTGMGFERLVAVLQGKSSNYDSDLFLPIFDAMAKESGKNPYSGIYNPNESNYELDYAYRLVADHARMCSVCIADGMYPQTNQRLRKILRKALNVCEQQFETKNLIQTAIVPKIVESLGFVYPELEKHAQSISEIINHERELMQVAVENNRINFELLQIPATSSIKEDDTVDFSNFAIAYRDVQKLMNSNKKLKSLPVEFVYNKLYIAGLSEDLIRKIADENELAVDMAEFEIYKNQKKLEAKSQHQLDASPLLNNVIESNVPPTNYHPSYDYDFDNASRQYVVRPLEAKVLAVEYNKDDGSHHIILDRTNFYHTAGGQDSDIGRMTSHDGGTFNVEEVTIHRGYVMHTGRFPNGTKPFQLNEPVHLAVDSWHRTHLSQHHTSMHLLQAALKKVTNRIVFQESSHVSASNLKCELGAIGKRISLSQLESVEELIRNVIRSNVPIETDHVSAHELYAINNLTTLPGATYPDENIRVLRVRDTANGFESIEPCCGTHATNTSELDDFCFTAMKVANSSSYHITAVAGRLVDAFKRREKEFLQQYAAFKEKLSANDDDNRSIKEWDTLDTEANALKRQILSGLLPYITSGRILSEMETLEKTIRTGKRATIRQQMVSEIEDALTRRNKFLIHVLETKEPLEPMLLAEAEQMCYDLPVILLNVSDNRIVNGRASVPLKYLERQDKKFDAKNWLRELVRPYKIKCSSKHKNGSSQSTLNEIRDHSLEPERFEKLLQQAAASAERAFGKSILADEKNRLVHTYNVKKQIQEIRDRVRKAKTLDDMINVATMTTALRNEIKVSLYSYELKSSSMAELAEMNDRIVDAQHEIEKTLYLPALEKSISTAKLNKKSYAFHAISTHHPLSARTILRMTDLCSNDMVLVLIIISSDGVVGRITVPFDHVNRQLTSKQLSDEFCHRFKGRGIHHGTRLQATVSDFVLKKSEVSEEGLKEIFKRIENLVGKAL